jgi:small subunit ribosomal protein S6
MSTKSINSSKAERAARNYEAVIILHPDVNEAEQKNFFKRNQETIQQYSGRVNHIDTWGKRRLANPINKMKLGSYFHTTFEAKGECVAELERLMRIDERVLRFLHLKLDDRKALSKHVEEFHQALAESHKREQEKEAKAQARRAAMGGGSGGSYGSRGPREVSYGRKNAGTGHEDEDGGEES